MLQGRRGGREGAHSALRPPEEPEKQPPQGMRNPGNWCPRSQADGSRRDGGVSHIQRCQHDRHEAHAGHQARPATGRSP